MKFACIALSLASAISSRAMRQPCGWVERDPVHIPDFVGAPIMAFDSARGVAVLATTDQFICASAVSEWGGDDWIGKSLDGPECRGGSAMVYDAERGVCVLFGGYNIGGDLWDTWEWDGQSWTYRNINGPGPREYHSMAYDAKRGVTVLFGGFHETENDIVTYGDTWEWDGEAWKQVADGGPGPTYLSPMAYDPERGVTVLFAVEATGGETWEWDGKSWVFRTDSGPGRRSGAAMVYSSELHACVLFGGRKGFDGMQNDTWIWDGQDRTRIEASNPPPARTEHAMAYDSHRDKIVLFGGQGNDNFIFADTWEFTCTPPCYPDFDGDGSLTLFDFLAFVNLFNTADPKADCDGSGVLDFFDFLCFTNAFNAGC